MNRQRLLLAILGGILLLSLAYAFWAMPRQETAPPRAVKAPAKAPRGGTEAKVAAKSGKAAGREVKADERLHLELLDVEPQPFAATGRDIFRFSGGWAPAPEPVAVVAPPPPVVEPPPPPPPPTPEQLLREKVARYTFLGFLEKGGVRTVFLSGDGQVYLVKAGDRFGQGEEMEAREVNARELVVGSPGGADIVRVQLVENERLAPTVFGAGEAAPSRSQGGSVMRAGGPGGAPRRIMPQRVFPRPAPQAVEPPEQDSQTDGQPPDDGVKQEELLKQEPPGGDGHVDDE